jgi:acyl-CoA thioester hydrolase
MNQTSFPYEIEIEVIFRDVDAMGHVNNAVFFTYMETARIKYITKIFDKTDLLDLPIILVKAECNYHSPALLGEILVAGIGLTRFGRSSFDLAYRIEVKNGRLIASGHTVQVMYDYHSRSAYPIPDDIRARVRAYQGDWGLANRE